MMKKPNIAQHWNERYASNEFAYGVRPNILMQEILDELTPGDILFPAEGEGRNAVYAATKGWKVKAFDVSEEGKKKAEQLAKMNNVEIQYRVGSLEELNFQINSFDCIVLVFAHFQPAYRQEFHQKIVELLKPDGRIILVGFHKENLPLRLNNPKVGGPPNIDMLFSETELNSDFQGLKRIEWERIKTKLSEGAYHQGEAEVLRMVGVK
jgi:SAM-dependent methyltransferase